MLQKSLQKILLERVAKKKVIDATHLRPNATELANAAGDEMLNEIEYEIAENNTWRLHKAVSSLDKATSHQRSCHFRNK